MQRNLDADKRLFFVPRERLLDLYLQLRFVAKET